MRTRLAVLVIGGCVTVGVTATCGSAGGQEDAPIQAIGRTDENSRIAHAQLLEKARTGRIDLYFEGDSITRRWGATDYPDLLADFRESFFGWNAANFGWGGDTTRNVLWRLEYGELDDVHPRVIVLLAGTNDVGSRPPADEAAGNRLVDEVSGGLGAILDRMREKAPGATIILMGLFPRNDNPAALPVIRRINARLAALADGDRVRYLDIGGRLADADGRLRQEVSGDGLHLSRAGYQIWAGALRPILLELLGPPSEEDLAPPPTGDPSAR